MRKMNLEEIKKMVKEYDKHYNDHYVYDINEIDAVRELTYNARVIIGVLLDEIEKNSRSNTKKRR
jgi:6-pyruvoyl-tetrahydropterin synthase